MSLLTLSAVTKRYGSATSAAAVSNLTLDIPAGSRTAIVGPSGSGKTTLLRLIAGFETPDQGRIALGDAVLADGTTAIPPHRRSIGYVAQEGALFPHLTIAANIGFGMERNAPGREARITELMQQVGLSSTMGERRPHQLSGGQQQRVALARAMARQPKIMLLDEPFSALDTGLREAMRDMVGDVLSDAGITTILVTHDQAEALSFADHLAVMRDGVVVQAGSPQDLYLRPADAQTARFLGDAIILQAVLDAGGAHTILGRIPTAPTTRRGNAMVMLRPEQLQLGLNGTELTTASRGRILARSFRGSAWRLSIEHQPVYANLDLPDSVLETSSIFTVETPGVTECGVGDIVAIAVKGTAHILA